MRLAGLASIQFAAAAVLLAAEVARDARSEMCQTSRTGPG